MPLISILLLSRSGFHYREIPEWKNEVNDKSRAYLQNCITNWFTSTSSWNFAARGYKCWQLSFIHIFRDTRAFWLGRGVFRFERTGGVADRTWRPYEESPSLGICCVTARSRLRACSATTPLSESLNWSSIGKQRVLKGVMKTSLTAQSFCQEVRLWNISLLSDKHANCTTCPAQSDDYLWYKSRIIITCVDNEYPGFICSRLRCFHGQQRKGLRTELMSPSPRRWVGFGKLRKC